MAGQSSQRKTKKPAEAVPVRSMTGYGRAVVEDGQRITAEIRSVNGRFLKLSVKLPGRYAAMEDRIKTLLANAGVKRGSIDVMVFFDGSGMEEGNYAIDAAAVKRYADQARAAARKCKLKPDVPLSALLPLPGVVRREEYTEELDVVWARTQKAMAGALAQFNGMREREGAALVADLRALLAQLAAHRGAIQAAAPEALKSSIQRFKDRLAKLLDQQNVTVPLNPDVLEREVVQMTDRTDISEELARLQSHFDQMEGTLAGGGETGKRLDFLTQELFRETNTIGSKAQDERITHHVVDMKSVIEKIREQVQNLE